MCQLCTFTTPGRWTRISKTRFKALMHQDKCNIEKCTKWAEVQCHEICVHTSHNKKTTWKECGQSKVHVNDMIVVMIPGMKEKLPETFDKETFERKLIPVTGIFPVEGIFLVDRAFRQKHHSTANVKFARTGVSSLSIQFSLQEKDSVRSFMKQVVNDKRKLRSDVGAYIGGRTGIRLGLSTLNKLKFSVLKSVLSQEVIDRVMYYFGVPSDSLMLYDSEIICTLPKSAAQNVHADVSLGGIEEPELQKSVMRLVVIMIVTFDGDATTEVYPNTRSETTFAEPNRPIWTAPDGHNCVLFDGRMAHNGVAYEGHEELHRLNFVFHHPDATKEQLKVIEINLSRKSLNINVQSMLASRSEEEAEMLPRRPAGPEMPAGGHGGHSAASVRPDAASTTTAPSPLAPVSTTAPSSP